MAMALRIAVCLAALLMPCSGSTEGARCEGSVCQPEADQDAVSALQFNLSSVQLGAQSRAHADCPAHATCPEDADCAAQEDMDCECEPGEGARKGAHAGKRDDSCACSTGVTSNFGLWKEAKAQLFKGARTTCRFECGECEHDGLPDETCCGFLKKIHVGGELTEFLCVEPPHGICVTKLCVRAEPEMHMAEATTMNADSKFCNGNSCTFYPAAPGEVCVETCAGELAIAMPVKHFVVTWEYCSSKHKLPTQKTSQATGRPWLPSKRGGYATGSGSKQIVTVSATMGTGAGGHPSAYTPSYTYQHTGAQKYS